jgi:hypothetical protein
MSHEPGHPEEEDGNLGNLANLIVFCQNNRDAPECAFMADVGGGAEDTAVSRTTTTAQDSFTKETTDEIIQQTQRVFFAVPTPEEFLNEFGNAFSGFIANAEEAGLSGGDINQMRDPSSGFMQQMLDEYRGELAQMAARGEDPFELAGLGGEQVQVGERPGQRVETETERVSRLETEAATRGGSTTITTPLGTTAGEGGEAQEPSGPPSTRTVTEGGTETGTAVSTADRTRTFEETEEIVQRPNITPIFKLSPTTFFLQRFNPGPVEGETPEEGRERFLGKLATELRASAPRQRPRGGSVAVSARRT